MPDTIIVSYILDRETWRKFYEAHYACDKGLKVRYVWGVICLLIGTAGFGGVYTSPLVATLLLATGLFAVLSKPLLVIKSLRTAVRHPFFGQELTVSISPGEIAVRSGNSGYHMPWSDFFGYRRLDPGFLLYHNPNAFFFIPETALTAGYAKRIETILDAAEVPKL